MELHEIWYIRISGYYPLLGLFHITDAYLVLLENAAIGALHGQAP